jgi:hypothetical protein
MSRPDIRSVAQDYIQQHAVAAPVSDQAILLHYLCEYPEFAKLTIKLTTYVVTHLQDLPLPDFCSALNALQKVDPSNITGEHLASLAKHLVQIESAPGGPYLENETNPLTLNIAIAQFAELHNETLPGVIQFLSESIDKANLFELWQMQALHIPSAKAQFLQRQKELPKNTPLQIVLSERPLTPYQHHLLAHYQPTEEAPINQSGFSSLIMTLLIYKKLTPALQKVPFSQEQTHITTRFKTDLQAILPDIEPILRSLLKTDTKGEISMLPSYFNSCLPNAAPQTTLQTLGVANLLVWLAYSLYDELIDQTAIPTMLPLANIAHRKALEYYRDIVGHSFYEYVLQVFTEMDKANLWELQNCRALVQDEYIDIKSLPVYGNGNLFANRAAAHYLGPIALLTAAGWQPAERRFLDIQQGFAHYLIARQLNDDLHDWKEDLQAGILSYTVAALLRACNVTNQTHYLPTLLGNLEQQFWQETLQHQCNQVITHIAQARELFDNHIQLQGPFNMLLEDIEQTARRGLQTWQQQRDFLTTF